MKAQTPGQTLAPARECGCGFEGSQMSDLQVDQRRADGSLRHLLTLEGLSRAELERLLNKAQTFVRPVGVPPG